ncbi:MAG: hypothetical protein R8K48_05050 [Gallionella sp.]
MSESKQRPFHRPERKEKVGLEANRGTKTVNQMGLTYGVHPAQVGLWKKEIQAHAKTLCESRRGPKPLTAPKEPDLLYCEIDKLKGERDWLKVRKGLPSKQRRASTPCF